MGKVFFFPARSDGCGFNETDSLRFEVFSSASLNKLDKTVMLHGNNFFHFTAERYELEGMLDSMDLSEKERLIFSYIVKNAGKKRHGFVYPSLMAIVNCTPDSFYPGSRVDLLNGLSMENILQMNADIIDIGGESTRPGSSKLPVTDEINRLLPVVRDISCTSSIPISIDTKNPETLERMLEFHIRYANDISGFSEERMRKIAIENNLDVILMHSRGTPETMQSMTHYDDIIAELVEFFFDRLLLLNSEGMGTDKIILDPGIGFAKTWKGNLEILRHIDCLDLGLRTLVGTSRKSFIGHVTGQTVEKRLPGTISTSIYLAQHGIDILRVHDLNENREALQMIRSICDFRNESL
ncbi:MAG: dihydropteroate synthase [Candidatus Thermoplasmatota archaeon]|nr:dihydropteroate synthase [Candidatus Thermoplasmatota archaeon]